MSGTPFGFDDDPHTPRRLENGTDAHPRHLTFDNDIVMNVVGVKEGGMGKILVGTLEGYPDRKFAVKAFDDRWFFNPQVRQAFQREISVWLQLSNMPFVFSAMNVTTIKGMPYVVMPLVEPGEDGAVSAGDLIRAGKGIDGGRVFEIALATAMGLTAASKKVPGLIHGDIKPDNILLPQGVAHISDFGLAQVLNTSREANYPSGTPEYLAPEIWAGKPRNTSGDVYAYGCMLYELLAGEPPYGRDRDTQRRAHCDAAMPPALPRDEASVSAALAALSARCMAKEASDRPDSFKEIVGELLKVGLVHAPDTTMRFTQYVVEYEDIGKELSKQIGGGLDLLGHGEENRIASLIEAGEIAVALEMLQAIPVENRSPNLLLMTGSALSLSGDDEQALEYFDRVLGGTSDADTLSRCFSEKGLSLRRLGRYDDAIAIYEQLARSASNEHLKMVIANHAGTLLDAGRLKEADLRAQWLTQRVPREASTWRLMGQIRQAQEQYDRAIDCFTQACRLDPGMAAARFERGVLLLERRLDLEGALADFDFAFGQNYQPKGLLVRLVVANVLLGRSSNAEALIRAIEEQDKGVADDVSRNAMLLVKDIGKKIVEHGAAKPGQAPSATPAGEGSFFRSVWSRIKKRFEQPPVAASPSAGNRFPSTRMEGALLLDESGSNKRMLGYRLYVDEAWAALDYYDDRRDREYPQEFGKGVRALFRSTISSVPGLTLRSSPFSFVRCTNCAHEMLTNRAVGELLLCRHCDQKGPIEIANDASSEDLIKECELAAGYSRRSLAGRTALLVIWTSQALDRKRVEEKAESLSWTQLPRNDLIARILGDERSSRGYGKALEDHLLLSRKCSASDHVHEVDATPWPAQELLIWVTETFGRQVSGSMTVSDDIMEVILESPADRIKALQKEYGDDPTDSVARGLLVKCLAVEGRLDEASALVPPGSRWTTSVDPVLLEGRGVLAHRVGRLSDARDLLEQARDRDPLDFSVRAFLVDVYREQNETDLAREEINQMRSIGMRLPA